MFMQGVPGAQTVRRAHSNDFSEKIFENGRGIHSIVSK